MEPVGSKPLDVGTGLVCASFSPDTGAWLSVGRPHEAVGFVELSNAPPFDERYRGDPEATRAHRQRLADPGHAFLRVELDGEAPQLVADLADPTRIAWHGRGVLVTAAPAADDAGAVAQVWHVGDRSVRLSLRGRLDRPALAEVTETDPPSPTGARTAWRVDQGRLVGEAKALPASVVVEVAGRPVRWTTQPGGAIGSVSPGPDPFALRIALGDPAAPPEPMPPLDIDSRLVSRALAYVRGCTALRTGPDERTILTDHRLLPLAWTRDGYWQALALLATDALGDRARVADHLRWLWRRCERPDGRWTRSHHANGRRKDLAFQADQQLYPIVELADYWRASGRLPVGVSWDVAVAAAWRAALEQLNPTTGLLATTETAADDPAELPFIAGTQILLWYVATRLAEMVEAGALEPMDHPAGAVAARCRAAFERHFGGAAGWPYAVDGRGNAIHYHDANDLPVALAPLWGFCRPNDREWSATMAAAFQPSNRGWADGELDGLGSVHTSGAWTLGDVQAWLVGRLTGDVAGAGRALDRLAMVAFPDGMLPEAYGPSRVRRVRHWFAWPGAALAALLLLDRRGELERRLSARLTR